MRLIDADTVRNPYAGTSLEWQGVLLLKLLEDEPTVDAVPVVRCEDCDTEPCDYYTAVDWCSRGHRRENEKR